MICSKNKLYWILGIALAFQWNACKKDTASSTPSVIGKWQVVKTTSDTTAEYFLFTDSKTGSRLTEDAFHAHLSANFNYQLEGDFLKLNEYSISLYKVSFNGDTLNLKVNDGSLPSFSNLKLVKRSSAPSVEEWTPQPTVLFKSSAPSGYSLGWFNSQLVLSDYIGDGKIKFIDPSTGVVTKSIEIASAQLRGVDGQGPNLWFAQDGGYKVSKVNAATGAVLFSSPSSPYQIDYIASDGTNIYCAGSSNDRLQLYNVLANSFGADIKTSSDIRDITFKNGYLYVVRVSGYIDKCIPSPYKAVKTWKVPNTYVSSITNDGTSFWIRGSNSITSEIQLQKISLD